VRLVLQPKFVHSEATTQWTSYGKLALMRMEGHQERRSGAEKWFTVNKTPCPRSPVCCGKLAAYNPVRSISGFLVKNRVRNRARGLKGIVILRAVLYRVPIPLAIQAMPS